jgi:cbb3-type cytochrome oxidase subunit 3
MEEIIVIVLMFVGIILLLNKRAKKRREKNKYLNFATEQEVEEQACSYQADIVDMGDWDIYPICPYCGKKVKSMVIVSSEEDDDYEPFTLVLCQHCKKPLPVF